ncbi:MAG: cupin domain-containing protein [Dokdonella sp.]
MIGKHASDLSAFSDSGYPEPFRSRCLPREKRKLGDAFGLTAFGVNLTTLAPGAESSMRHWHDREDELVYVLEGELTLRTDEGEETLTAGMVVGFRAGDENAHQFVNRSDQPVRYLEVGNRDSADTARYSDVDLKYGVDTQGNFVYTHKDGRPY